MVDRNKKFLIEFKKLTGNNLCAECNKEAPMWASCAIGIFLCTECAHYHKTLGVHINSVKHIELDSWSESDLKNIKEIGNERSKSIFESYVPLYYKRPCPDSPQIIKEEWIRAKYCGKEFMYPHEENYYHGKKEGFLWKKGKVNDKYCKRKFILNDSQYCDTLKYFIKENEEPKAVIKIGEINAAFVPFKMGKPTGLQISFMKDGCTRHIYVYHDAQEIMSWYLALRCAKLQHLMIAYPTKNPEQLSLYLSNDLKEGWLWKTGPRQGAAFRRRWFTLEGRKLMYHEQPLDANPRGEIFLGCKEDGFLVNTGVPEDVKTCNYPFTLVTNKRIYVLAAETDRERHMWMTIIQNIFVKPMSAQEYIKMQIVNKDVGGSMLSFRS